MCFGGSLDGVLLIEVVVEVKMGKKRGRDRGKCEVVGVGGGG